MTSGYECYENQILQYGCWEACEWRNNVKEAMKNLGEELGRYSSPVFKFLS